MICRIFLTQYFSYDQIEKNELGGICNTYGVEERNIRGFGGENWGKIPLGEPGVDGRIILR